VPGAAAGHYQLKGKLTVVVVVTVYRLYLRVVAVVAS